jgi:hypothetical protein
MDTLNLEIVFDRFLGEAAELERIFSILSSLKVYPDAIALLDADGSEVARPIDAASFASCVHRLAFSRGGHYRNLVAKHGPPPFERAIGSATIAGVREDLELYLRVDEYSAAPRGAAVTLENHISGDVKLTGASTAAVRTLVSTFATHCAPVWATAYANAEYEAKNMERSHGIRALGRDVSRFLPGLYWLNFFGEPYVQLIGAARFDALDGVHVERLESGYIVQLSRSPLDWESAEYRAAETRVLDQLGRQFFFRREAPDAPSAAPAWNVGAGSDGVSGGGSD